MGFHWIDYSIICAYLAGVTYLGIRIAGTQKSINDYFLGSKTLPWWAVGFSVVASETSTLTFISVPGLAYQGNMNFLQLAFGYFIGRCLVSTLFIPAYYEGKLETAYHFIGKRFGLALRQFTSSVFIITRILSSGVRLFASSIPLSLITGLDYSVSILLIATFTLIYTYVGGRKAVVFMDVVQMFVYLGGAFVAMAIILNHLPGGWNDVLVFSTRPENNKFSIINTPNMTPFIDWLSSPYTFVGSILGGTFLTMASHGTDHLLVQRLLACRTVRDSQKALLLDAIVIVLQFTFFLILGLCLFTFYRGASFQELGLSSSDEIFPKFIVEHLPIGLAGLVIAGVLASAMGTLSSAINSLASSSYIDLIQFFNKAKPSSFNNPMRWSKILTLFWGLFLIGGALLFTKTQTPIIEVGLNIASVTYGGLLGIFFLGLFFRRPRQKDASIGFIIGLLVMVLVLTWTNIDYTWHTLIGCIVTIWIGNVGPQLKRFKALIGKRD